MFFSIMIDIKKLHILVVGGGKILYRKVKYLLDFNCYPTVVSSDFRNVDSKINLIKDKFDYKYLKM